MNGTAGSSGEVVRSVHSLRTHYATADGVFAAVRDVSFEVRRLERLGIVGESGSGKSALSLSILGLIDPPGQIVSGQVYLNGRDIRALVGEDLRTIRGGEIAIGFQDPRTGRDLTKCVGG